MISPNPTGKNCFFSVEHEKKSETIYPGRLSVSQVAQGGRSGDCYLLSVINAIVALPRGEEYIRELMIDKDNQIYVRFFKENKPQWFVIEKSLPTSWGILSSGAPWVRFLEKAYVIFMGGNYNKILENGDGRKVLQALLGDRYDTLSTTQQARYTLAQLYKKVIYGCNGKDIYSLIFLLRPHDSLANVDNMLFYIFSQKRELLKAWWIWVAANQKHFVKMLEDNSFITKEEFIAFINKRAVCSNAPLQAIEAVKTWLHQYAILPDDAEYSYDELELFDALRSAHEEQRPIICSPKEDPPEGITIRHTYALIGIKESTISNKKFVILRNPHPERRHWLLHYLFYGGRHATEYQDEKGTHLVISPVRQSTFTMELRDFAHAFYYIDLGRSLLDNNLIQTCEEDKLGLNF